MIRHPARLLMFVTMIALALLACASANHRTQGDTCLADTECQSGFCDGSLCAEPDGNYGASCVATLRTEDGRRDARIETCGAYLCSTDRCRSCTSDAQCQADLGAPRCQANADHKGMRCGH